MSRARFAFALALGHALALAVGLPVGMDRARADEPRVCFSPSGGCQALVVAAIDAARSTIDAAVYSFTDPILREALARAAARGVTVRLVIDAREAEAKSCEATSAEAAGVQVKALHGLGRGGLMHDKFAVIDGRWLETGSFNWTRNAEKDNAENALVLDDSALAARYESEFARLWTDGVRSHGSSRTASSRE